jgi:hypothetical protein
MDTPAHLKKVRSPQKEYVFDGSCVGDDCILDMPGFTVRDKDLLVDIEMLPSFSHWTSVDLQPQRSAGDRRTYGCQEILTTVSKGKNKGKKVKKFTGKRCKKKSGCKPSELIVDAYCKANVEPCAPKAPCPISITFKDGKPYLRLCKDPYEPGHLIKVPGRKENWPQNAQKLALKACANWPRSTLPEFDRDMSKEDSRAWANKNWPEDFFANEVPAMVAGRAGLGETFTMQAVVPDTGERWTQEVEADDDMDAYLKMAKTVKVKNAMKRHSVAVAPPGYSWTDTGWKKGPEGGGRVPWAMFFGVATASAALVLLNRRERLQA